GFTAASRSVLAVARDPDDDSRLLVASAKANNTGAADGLAYRIVGVCPKCSIEVEDGGSCRACCVQSVGRVTWDDQPVRGLDANAILGAQASPEEREERSETEQFLSEALRHGPRWSDALKMEGGRQG